MSSLESQIAHPQGIDQSGLQNGFKLPGWWFGTFFIFPSIGNFIIPTDELHHFSEGKKPPTS